MFLRTFLGSTVQFESFKSVLPHNFVCVWFNSKFILALLRRFREHYTMFVERLNCRYVLVDCLEKEGIITEEERRNIMEADGDVATRTYEDIPESCWPQMRDSEQMLRSNKELLQCLFEKNYSQISKFLKLVEDTGLTHLLNSFIGNEGIYSFLLFLYSFICIEIYLKL